MSHCVVPSSDMFIVPFYGLDPCSGKIQVVRMNMIAKFAFAMVANGGSYDVSDAVAYFGLSLLSSELCF